MFRQSAIHSGKGSSTTGSALNDLPETAVCNPAVIDSLPDSCPFYYILRRRSTGDDARCYRLALNLPATAINSLQARKGAQESLLPDWCVQGA